MREGHVDDVAKQFRKRLDGNDLELLVPRLAFYCVPEAFFPLGFNEVRFSLSAVDDPDVPQDLVGLSEELSAELASEISGPMSDGGYLCDKCRRAAQMMFNLDGTQFRDESGTWHGFEYCFGKLLPPPRGHDDYA